MNRAFLYACAAAVGVVGAARADQTIGFDNLANSEVVADQYRSLGVVFGGNWVVSGPGAFTNAVSAPNSVVIFDPADQTNNYTVSIDFVVPGTSQPGSVQFFAFTPTDASSNNTQIFMRAYNPAGFEIGDAVTFVDGGGVYDPAVDTEIMYTAVAGQSISHIEVAISCLSGNRVIEGDNFRFGPILVPCGPADIGSAGGFAGPDQTLDNNDFIAFINYFFASDPTADRGSTGGFPGSDGLFDNNDFIVFINQFFAGC